MKQKGSCTGQVAYYESSSHAANAPCTTTSPPAHAETDGNAYVYEALAIDRPRIRLITVWHGARRASYPHPPSESDEILCTIGTFEAAKAPSYIALSYTWGNPVPLHTIRLNGDTYNIRENLFDFLKAFGAMDVGQQSHYLWIDQLCIDQSNTRERNYQVSIMADVYRNAQFVISWFDQSCLEAFRALATGYLGFDGRHLRTTTILSNQYFSRLWIVQEVLLAKEIEFMCGDVWINYWVLRHHSQALYRSFSPTECDNARSLFNTKDKLVGNSRNLVYVLNHGGSVLRCEDGRDQVYGLLGIVGPSQHVPEVSYQDSVQQVYLDTIRIILTESQNQAVDSILDCAENLAENMCLPHEHLSAIRELLKDIRTYHLPLLGQLGFPLNNYDFEKRPVIHKIGLDSSKSPGQWWYEDVPHGATSYQPFSGSPYSLVLTHAQKFSRGKRMFAVCVEH